MKCATRRSSNFLLHCSNRMPGLPSSPPTVCDICKPIKAPSKDNTTKNKIANRMLQIYAAGKAGKLFLKNRKPIYRQYKGLIALQQNLSTGNKLHETE